MALEIIRVGRYRARYASSQIDVLAAQSLRYQCFNLSNKDELDVDDFDALCQHILIENLETEKLICCYRILKFDSGKNISSSYSSQFYDLKVIENFTEPMIEVGRFCIDPEVNDPSVVLTAWAALAQIVDHNQTQFLFGCSSFEGIEKEKYFDSFALLRDRYMAPDHWRPKIKAAQVFCYSKDLIYKVDKKKALLNMPPLLKTYLSMGAWVSDHAVVDLNMKTLHLFTGMEISKIPKSRKKFLLNLA
jgi:putative hemolysin